MKSLLIRPLRMKTIIYRLTMEYSIKYCEDENFRYQLLQKVENPLKQIIVTLSYSRIKCHEDLFDLPPIHVICSRFQDSSHKFSLRNVKEFKFDGYTFGYDYHYNSDEDEDICGLLNVSQCEKVTFEFCSSITDISLLQGCEQIILENCENIIDFSSLGKQRSLSINTNPL